MALIQRKQTQLRNRLGPVATKFFGSNFGGNVAKLAGGSVVAQLCVLAVSPILTRLYSPEEFGYFGVFTAVLMMVAVVSCLRYQIAIPLPSSNTDAHGLVIGCILAAATLAAAATVVLAVWGEHLLSPIGLAPLYSDYWVLTVGIFAIGINQTLIYYALRKQKYGDISIVKMRQGIFQAIAQLVLGVMHLGPIGLMAGYVVGRSAGSIFLIKSARSNGLTFSNTSVSLVGAVCYRYRKFPLIYNWGSLINSAAVYLMAPMLAVFYDAKTVGWFTLGQWVVGIPTDLVAQAVAKAYLGRASSIVRERKNLREFLQKIIVRLALFGGLPTLLLCLPAPWIFELFFGSDWRTAGEYTQVLGIMFAIRFVVAPVSQTLNILERQGLQFYWDLLRVVFVVMAIVAAGVSGASALMAISIYVVVMSIAYLALLILTLRVASSTTMQHD